MRIVARWLGAALVLLTGVALYLRVSAARRPVNPLPVPTIAPARLALTPASRTASASTRLPSGAIGLAALTVAAQTTFVALQADGRTEPLAGPFVVDGRTPRLRAGVLAYLVLPGLDPAENYVEVRDFARDARWQIRPDEASAIFGFALDPQGARLIYLEADARVAGGRVPWWVVNVDLITGAKNVILAGAELGTIALLPYAWESGVILFRGLTPFTDQYHGLWAAQPDGSQLRRVAAEADFVGWPRASPEGDRLALLVSDPSALPAAYGAGEPPANALRILDLRSGQFTAASPPSPQHDLTAIEWVSDSVMALRGEWDVERNIFVHRSVAAIQPEAGRPPTVLYSVDGGEITQLAPCPNGDWLAAIQFEDETQIIRAGQSERLTTIAGQRLDWLACLASEAAR